MKRIGLLLALALLPACDKPVTFSYFLIAAKLDPNTVGPVLKDFIQTCAVTAHTPQRDDVADLHCQRHQITNDIGTFEYTTTLTQGSIKFELVVNDYNLQLVARGESMAYDIKPGQTVMGEVTAVAVPSQYIDGGVETPDSGSPSD